MRQIRQERVQWAMERYGSVQAIARGGARSGDGVDGGPAGGAAALDSEQEIYASLHQPEPVLGVSLA
jgi:hypothetical protein